MQAPSTPVSLHEVHTDYVEWLRLTQDLSKHTVRAYISDTRMFVLSIGEETTPANIDGRSMRSFFEHQRTTGRRSSTLRRRACGVRSFCGYLVRAGHLDVDPWATSEITFRRVRTLPRAISLREVNQLIQHLCERARVRHGATVLELPQVQPATTLLATTLMVTTGMRVGELVATRVEDVDVDRSVIRIMGKGQRERVVFVTDPWIQGLLDRYIDRRAQLSLPHAHLLFNARLSPMSTAGIRDRVARASQDAGLSRRVTPHMLRHTAATQLIESGVDIRFVQRLLGHASLTTTEIYTHVSNAALRSAITNAQVLNRAMTPEPNGTGGRTCSVAGGIARD